MAGSENTFLDESLGFEGSEQRAYQVPGWVRWCAVYSWNLKNREPRQSTMNIYSVIFVVISLCWLTFAALATGLLQDLANFSSFFFLGIAPLMTAGLIIWITNGFMSNFYDS